MQVKILKVKQGQRKKIKKMTLKGKERISEIKIFLK